MPNNYSGSYLVPLDKGGDSDTDHGFLPNYFVPTEYYLDWRIASVKGMYKEAHSDMANPEYRFKNGITYSRTGQYAPTFRISAGGILESKSCGIFPKVYTEFYILGIINSKLARFLIKNFIMHTVESSVGTLPTLVVPFSDENQRRKVESLVTSIVSNQQKDNEYDFLGNEQKDLDALVYQLFNLTSEQINEVEIWFARRYPKLAKYAYIKPKEELVKEEKKKVSGCRNVSKNSLHKEKAKHWSSKAALNMIWIKKVHPPR
jgi:hypothetical protein